MVNLTFKRPSIFTTNVGSQRPVQTEPWGLAELQCGGCGGSPALSNGRRDKLSCFALSHQEWEMVATASLPKCAACPVTFGEGDGLCLEDGAEASAV
ncbi:Ring Finger Protein 17 [Manis pentadactyla]|nr:Ring Finger Protein 17 [Manis pentadactyla]